MSEFVRVADVSEVADPGKLLVEVNGDVVALFHVEGRFYALDDVCTHDGGPLVDGELVDHKIACPRHGAKFDIRTGAALSMPAVRPTRSHAVKVENGGVWVAIGAGADTAPGPGGPGGFRSAATSPSANGETARVPAAPSAAGGDAPAAAGAAGPSASGSEGVPTEESVREWLKEVKDPELFVNIVDLGLVYGVTLSPAADAPGKQHVAIDMTMTSPACPAGPQLIADTKRAVGSRETIAAVEVRIVMDPPWTPDRMTDAARDQLGIF
jgi:metal-sulfur cluster biosynthetic enzyme/nitrite reductase/ring-hydroxylating ferredoxin subunit